jgi:hypothetical protein
MLGGKDQAEFPHELMVFEEHTSLLIAKLALPSLIPSFHPARMFLIRVE